MLGLVTVISNNIKNGFCKKKTDKSALHLSDIVMSYGNLILMGSKM